MFESIVGLKSKGTIETNPWSILLFAD